MIRVAKKRIMQIKAPRIVHATTSVSKFVTAIIEVGLLKEFQLKIKVCIGQTKKLALGGF
jgi:hypothetical protein